ncbi:hypothetical protein B0H10DRAFT_2448347 [Mycena sp. CBHHK59/15]|nr:hypothetical protein B0H10DRAFT_2448347 [Mycena sp. CBHHK59/15]
MSIWKRGRRTPASILGPKFLRPQTILPIEMTLRPLIGQRPTPRILPGRNPTRQAWRTWIWSFPSFLVIRLAAESITQLQEHPFQVHLRTRQASKTQSWKRWNFPRLLAINLAELSLTRFQETNPNRNPSRLQSRLPADLFLPSARIFASIPRASGQINTRDILRRNCMIRLLLVERL